MTHVQTHGIAVMFNPDLVHVLCRSLHILTTLAQNCGFCTHPRCAADLTRCAVLSGHVSRRYTLRLTSHINKIKSNETLIQHVQTGVMKLIYRKLIAVRLLGDYMTLTMLPLRWHASTLLYQVLWKSYCPNCKTFDKVSSKHDPDRRLDNVNYQTIIQIISQTFYI